MSILIIEMTEAQREFLIWVIERWKDMPNIARGYYEHTNEKLVEPVFEFDSMGDWFRYLELVVRTGEYVPEAKDMLNFYRSAYKGSYLRRKKEA